MTLTAEALETIEKHANVLKAARVSASEGSVSIGALNAARQNYDDVSQPETLLSIIAEVRRLRDLDTKEVALLRDVLYYADSVCGMLRQGGWPGKAEALESRIKAVIDFDKENA